MADPGPSGAKPTPSKSHFKAKQDRQHVKHYILEKYIQAWAPIMTQGGWRQGEKVLLVDGFAGKGTFDGGEDGSPVVALKALIRHLNLKNFVASIELICIEKDKKSAKILELNLEKVAAESDTAGKITTRVINGEFKHEFEFLLNDPGYNHCPILLFADPFGWKAMPMNLIQRVLKRPKSEVFLNVMSGSTNRFFNVEYMEKSITEFVGSEEWIGAVREENLTPQQKLQRFITTYEKNVGAKFTLHFGMRDKAKNRHIYHLVFATNHEKGLEVMKTAMTNASQDIESLYFSEHFSARVPQVDIKTKNYKILGARRTLRLLWELHHEDSRTLSGGDIEDYVLKKTQFVLNFRPELKKALMPFAVQKVTKFEDLEIKFSRVLEEDVERILRDQLLLESTSAPKPSVKKPNASTAKREKLENPTVPTMEFTTSSKGLQTPTKCEMQRPSETGVTPELNQLKVHNQNDDESDKMKKQKSPKKLRFDNNEN